MEVRLQNFCLKLYIPDPAKDETGIIPMPWMDCPRIDVRKSIAVLIAMIAVALVSVIICWYILMKVEADGVVTIVCCAAVLLVELTVFRFLQDSKAEKLYFKNSHESDAFIIRKDQ